MDLFAHGWAPASRHRCYAALTLVCLAIAVGFGVLRAVSRRVPVEFAVSDAQGYYVYLPALVIHHSLDIEPSLRDQAATDSPGAPAQLPDSFHRDTRGRLLDRYPLGVAITLAPGFAVAHVLSIAANVINPSPLFIPNGYTVIYQLFSIAMAMTAGLIGMLLIDRLLDERFNLSGPSILAGVLLYWIGSNYFYYFTREPIMAHVISAGWMIATVFFAHRTLADAEAKRFAARHWFALTFCFGMAVICRYTNVFITPLLIATGLLTLRRGLLPQWLRATPLMLLGLAPLILQLLFVRAALGGAHAQLAGLGYDPYESFMWTRPALAQTLLSACHGLFSWSPVLLAALPGVAVLLFRDRRRSLLLGLVASAAVLWYLNSAWTDWWFGWSFGARAFIELAPLFIIGLAGFCELLRDARPSHVRLAAAALCLCVCVNFGLMGLYVAHVIPRSDYPWALSTAAAERAREPHIVPTVAVPRYAFFRENAGAETRAAIEAAYP